MAALNSIHAKVMKKVFSQWFELFIDVMLYLNPLIIYMQFQVDLIWLWHRDVLSHEIAECLQAHNNESTAALNRRIDQLVLENVEFKRKVEEYKYGIQIGNNESHTENVANVVRHQSPSIKSEHSDDELAESDVIEHDAVIHVPIKIDADDERFSSEEDSDHPDIGSSCDIVEEFLVPLEACGGDDHEAEQQRIDSQSLSDDSQTSEPETPPAVVKLNRERKQINYAELSQGDDDELETEDLQSESGKAFQ